MLHVENLTVSFNHQEVLHGINFSVQRGEILGIVGESGSGKSVTSLAIMGLLPDNAHVNGSIKFYTNKEKSIELIGLQSSEHRKLRGSQIAMIFQEPQTSLNPSMRCGTQLLEAVLHTSALNKKEGKQRCIELLTEMQLPDPEKVYRSYPHQLSGGQKQRVMIAIAIAGNPSLLIADEPTTALDVTVQKEIINLLKEIKENYNIGIIFISHDLSVIEEVANRVVVMQNGKIVEQNTTRNIFDNPQSNYTRKLIDLKKQLQNAKPLATEKQNALPIFRANNISIRYTSEGLRNKSFLAVNNVSFSLFEGEVLGLVGESGSGKSTIGRLLLKLIKSSSGNLSYKNKPIDSLTKTERQEFRRNVQLVFQDPYSSLNPRLTVGRALTEPIVYYNIASKKNAVDLAVNLLEKVNLPADSIYRYPHEFSGGQRQRIVLARALTVNPTVLICDEIVSALDIAIQAQILELLKELKCTLNLTYLFISHDLSIVRSISNRVIVINKGSIVEQGATEDVFDKPQSEYTKRLIESVPGFLSKIS